MSYQLILGHHVGLERVGVGLEISTHQIVSLRMICLPLLLAWGVAPILRLLRFAPNQSSSTVLHIV